MDFMTTFAGDECKAMMADPDARIGFTLLVNRRKDGSTFVCELVMLTHKHPKSGWYYSVGLQSDITSAVSVAELLAAASTPMSYGMLMQSREAGVQERVQQLGVDNGSAMQYLHEKAGEMWKALMLELLPTISSKGFGTSNAMSGADTTFVDEIGSTVLDEDDDADTWETRSKASVSSVAASDSISVCGPRPVHGTGPRRRQQRVAHEEPASKAADPSTIPEDATAGVAGERQEETSPAPPQQVSNPPLQSELTAAARTGLLLAAAVGATSAALLLIRGRRWAV